MIDLNQFYAWANELPHRRSVRIEIRDNGQQIFVWDDKYMIGQLVQSVDEIDLRNEQIKYYKRKLKELEELENEFNTVANSNPN